MGAGVIPFSVHEREVFFLFQTVFEGRKTGFLNDFGGGLAEGESYRETAIREFVEETETMFFAEQIGSAMRTVENIRAQLPILEQLFDNTLSHYPDWWRVRKSPNPAKPKDWRSYFIRFPYRELEAMNRLWEQDREERFKKRRQLFWVGADELLAIYRDQPERLWRRVRQLDRAPELIREIRQKMLAEQ